MFRPFTATADDIVEYVSGLRRVDALLNNTHLAEETTPSIVKQGAQSVVAVVEILNLPIVASAAPRLVALEMGGTDCMGNPVWPLDRFMPRSFW